MTVYPVIRLQPNRHKRAITGHPWVYSNEIHMDAAAKTVPAGSIVRLARDDGRVFGTAMFNPHTLIAARLLNSNADARIDVAFIEKRLSAALALRSRLYDRPYYRLVHAEADDLPALIIDRYGDVLAVQANAAGIDRMLPDILAVLERLLCPTAIILRHDSPARALEQLALETRLVTGSLNGPLRLEENGAMFFVDPLEGQKTGWFYDQRDNRAFIAGLAKDMRVIDFYSYAGGFAIQCARAGATSVVAVDRSEGSLALAAQSAAANNLELECRRAEAFAELERLAAAKERFDIVIADPPAFVKSKKDLAAGAQGYRKLARLAAGLVSPGGFLLIGSCSHHVEPALFAEKVAQGLGDAGRSGRVIRFAGAGPDHPVHPLLPESAYLKAQVLQLD